MIKLHVEVSCERTKNTKNYKCLVAAVCRVQRMNRICLKSPDASTHHPYTIQNAEKRQT